MSKILEDKIGAMVNPEHYKINHLSHSINLIMKLFYFSLFILLITTGCKNDTRSVNSELNDPIVHETEILQVEYAGALKNFMHENDLSAKIDLADLKERKDNLFALGALENLNGEILIYNGTPYISTLSEDKKSPVIDQTFEWKAGLLVYTNFSAWVEIEIADSIRSYEQLENYLEIVAQEHGIPTDEPFPFRLEGPAASVEWHIIDWPEGDSVHTHEKHKTSGLHGVETNWEAEFLGFYSDAHHAIFTHHTTNMHIHAINAEKSLAVHIDDLMLNGGMRLFLPRLNY